MHLFKDQRRCIFITMEQFPGYIGKGKKQNSITVYNIVYNSVLRKGRADLYIRYLYMRYSRTSLAVQWLRLRASIAGDVGSIPGQGTKILHAERHG